MTAAPRALRGPKLLAEMTAGERDAMDRDVRCLNPWINMLERVNGVCPPIFPFHCYTLALSQTFKEISTLKGILGGLIVPAPSGKSRCKNSFATTATRDA
jgi:hypothetical protein